MVAEWSIESLLTQCTRGAPENDQKWKGEIAEVRGGSGFRTDVHVCVWIMNGQNEDHSGLGKGGWGVCERERRQTTIRLKA